MKPQRASKSNRALGDRPPGLRSVRFESVTERCGDEREDKVLYMLERPCKRLEAKHAFAVLELILK